MEDFDYVWGGEFDDWYYMGGFSFFFIFGGGSGVNGWGIGCLIF